MTDNIEMIKKGNFMRSLLRKICFATFGITAFVNFEDKYNIVNILYGIVVGLIFGFLCKAFLSGILGMLNGDLKQNHGRKVISYTVERGMAFMIPFAVMAALATFYMGWSMTSGFVSAAIMTAGVSAASEIGKLKGKAEFKNTIFTSVISWAFSTLWLFSAGYLGKFPAYIEGGVKILKSLSGNILK